MIRYSCLERVTSHASGFPLADGIVVTPSGRLLPRHTSRVGSLCADICALLFHFQAMSRIKCGVEIVAGEQELKPSLVATEILISASVSLHPNEAIRAVVEPIALNFYTAQLFI